MSRRTAVPNVDMLVLWVTLPPVLLLSAYFIRKWYLARRLRLHGIGKGAPGFQTNVQRIRVTPEIAARIRRGEDVSPEEIERAHKEALEAEKRAAASSASTLAPQSAEPERSKEVPNPVNEWLPESITAPKRRPKGRRK